MLSTYSSVIFGKRIEWQWFCNFGIPGMVYFLSGVFIYEQKKKINKLPLSYIIVLSLIIWSLLMIEVKILLMFNVRSSSDAAYFFTFPASF